MLFANSTKISQQYKLSATVDEDLSILFSNSMNFAIVALSNNMRKLIIKRQKSSSILKITQ